jgi:peptidylprolyl isomerase
VFDRHPGATAVSNNHFDQDGLVSVLALAAGRLRRDRGGSVPRDVMTWVPSARRGEPIASCVVAPHLRTWSLAALMGLGGTLVLSSCSSGGAPSASGSSGSTSTTSSTAHIAGGALVAVGTIPSNDLSPAGTAGTSPTVTVPSGSPPTQLESADLIKGTGALVSIGHQATVQYVLATYSSRKVIQSSWTSQPFTFVVGEGQVIPGWDKGVIGMRVGGRRELIIPPGLGYKNRSPGPGIAPNDTLVFVIDLLNVSEKAA